MAKRKGSARGGLKKAVKRASKTSAAARKGGAKKKSAARRPSATAAKRKAGKSAKKRAAPRKAGPKKTALKKTATRKAAPKKSAARKTAARKTARKAAPTPKAARRLVATAKTTRRTVPSKAAGPRRIVAPVRKAPSLNRDRRTVTEDDVFPTPPSSLDLDRSASAVRTGRRAMRERFEQHTETSPALTGGDVDADWESAYSVGDEAPGGDNPTPDQDLVDDIGRAVGVEYQDNEELKGEEKIADRDRHRWELDPASAEDYDEH
jgi:hypothetical protein